MKKHLLLGLSLLTLIAFGGVSQTSPLNARLAKVGAQQPAPAAKTEVCILYCQQKYLNLSDDGGQTSRNVPAGVKVINQSSTAGVPDFRQDHNTNEVQLADALAKLFELGFVIYNQDPYGNSISLRKN